MKLMAHQILFLKSIPHVGNSTILKLISMSFESFDEVLLLLAASKKIDVTDFIKNQNKLNDAMEIIETNIAEWKVKGIYTLGYNDDLFPPPLKIINNKAQNNTAPSIVFYKGDVNILKNHKSITVIGSREPTQITVKASEFVCRYLAEHKINIVSGLAIGCDTLAHLSALKHHSPTTAVLPQGIDEIYPKQNFSLAEKIVNDGGLLISEIPPGTKVTKYSLVERDRIQSGLSDKTIVLQAKKDGGTMHAAMSAIYNKKDLFIIDYKNISNENRPMYTGFDVLLENGAKKINSKEMSVLLASDSDGDSKQQHDLFSI